MRAHWRFWDKDCIMVFRLGKQRIGCHIHVWQRFPAPQKKSKMTSQDILKNASTLASYNVLLQVHVWKFSKLICSLLLRDQSDLLVLSNGFIPGDVPCPHLFAQCIHTSVCVQRADWSCQCQVKMTDMLRQESSATSHDKQSTMPTFNCIKSSCCNLFVCVFITQAHTVVLNAGIFIQRSFPQSLSVWGIRHKPQLETSYQPAVADVSWFYKMICVLDVSLTLCIELGCLSACLCLSYLPGCLWVCYGRPCWFACGCGCWRSQTPRLSLTMALPWCCSPCQEYRSSWLSPSGSWLRLTCLSDWRWLLRA